MLIKTIEKLEECNLDVKNHQALAVITAIELICNESKSSKLEFSKTIFNEISSKSGLSVATVKKIINKLIDGAIIIKENHQIYIQEVLKDFQKRQKRNQNKKKYRKSQNVNRDNPKSLKIAVKSAINIVGKKIKNLFGNKSEVIDIPNKMETPKSQLKQSEPSNSSKKTVKKKNYQKNNLGSDVKTTPTNSEDDFQQNQITNNQNNSNVGAETYKQLLIMEKKEAEKRKVENEQLNSNLAHQNEMLKRSYEATLAHFSPKGKGNTSNNQISKNESQYNTTNDAVIESKHLMENVNTPKQVLNEIQSDVSIPKDDFSKISSIQQENIQKSKHGNTQDDQKYDINYSDNPIIENESENDLQSLLDSPEIQDVNTPIQMKNEIQSNVSDSKSQLTENKSQQKLDIILPKSQDSPKKQSNQVLSEKKAINDTLLDEEKESYSIYDDGSRAEGDVLTNYERKYRINWWRFQPKELLKMSNFDIHKRVMDKNLTQSNIEYMLMRSEKIDKFFDSQNYHQVFFSKMSALFVECKDFFEFRMMNKAQAIKQRNLALARHFDLPYEVVRLINSHNHTFENDYFGSNYDFIEKNLEALREVEIEKLPQFDDSIKLPPIINEFTLFKFLYIYKFKIYLKFKENNKISESTKLKIENSEKNDSETVKIEEKKVKKSIKKEKNNIDISDVISKDKDLLIKHIFEIYDLEEKIKSYPNLNKIYVEQTVTLKKILRYKDLTLGRLESALNKFNKWVVTNDNDGNFWRLFLTFLKNEKKDKE